MATSARLAGASAAVVTPGGDGHGTRAGVVVGSLRLLDDDFPHRMVMQDVAEHNAKEALALLVQ